MISREPQPPRGSVFVACARLERAFALLDELRGQPLYQRHALWLVQRAVLVSQPRSAASSLATPTLGEEPGGTAATVSGRDDLACVFDGTR